MAVYLDFNVILNMAKLYNSHDYYTLYYILYAIATSTIRITGTAVVQGSNRLWRKNANLKNIIIDLRSKLLFLLKTFFITDSFIQEDD